MSSAEVRRGLLIAILLAVGVFWAFGVQPNPRLQPGMPIGEISAELANGDTFVLSQHRGQVVVVNFWATWCQPCRKEAPILSRLHKSGVQVVGLAIDPLPLQTIQSKAQRFGMDYPVGLGSSALIDRLGIHAVPTTCVVGKDGTVVKTISGLATHDELAAAIAGAR